jgi:hypothetical protein
MSGHHHERFDRSEVPLPSDRSVGFNFAVVALVIAYFWRADHSISRAAVIMAAALVGAGILAPAVLRPLNIAWFKFGQILHRLVSPVVMLAIFIIAIVPFGLIMQMRADPLRKNRQRNARSYWIERERSAGSLPSMRNQF